jgi:hypothetical protein
LEFPEVMAKGGFDCILGNPPYLGDKALSGKYGHGFCEYVRHAYSPAGLNDLVVYFLRRIVALVRASGFTALITTNSVKDGDIRRGGLEQIVAVGAEINMVVRAVRWPGRANVIVSLLAIHNGKWPLARVLDGQQVAYISPFFEEVTDAGEPAVLLDSQKKVFTGYYWLGDGFLLTHEEAKELIDRDAKNAQVVFRVINGHELNNEPDQSPQRSIINFHDWSEQEARAFPAPFELVERHVKPFRAKRNRERNRDVWWLYAENRPGLTAKLKPLKRCFVTANTTKYLNFSAVSTDCVVSHPQNILTTDRWDLFTVVQSTLHEVWARKYSGALKQDLRYSPSKCFDTFAFPGRLWQTANSTLAAIGEKYHEHRKALMLSLWLGLTDTYNLFHARELSAAKVAKVSKKSAAEAERGYQGLLELRRLHVELDQAVLHAYGWDAGGANNGTAGPINLAHDFYEVETLPENDRVRYTISPAARKEVLKRLLALNHGLAKAEAGSMPVKGKKRRSKGEEDEESSSALFKSKEQE